MPSKPQALLFDKDQYTALFARDWLRKNKLVAIKRVHKTDKYLRYRLRAPNKAKSHRTIELKKGILMIIEY